MQVSRETCSHKEDFVERRKAKGVGKLEQGPPDASALCKAELVLGISTFY